MSGSATHSLSGSVSRSPSPSGSIDRRENREHLGLDAESTTSHKSNTDQPQILNSADGVDAEVSTRAVESDEEVRDMDNFASQVARYDAQRRGDDGKRNVLQHASSTQSLTGSVQSNTIRHISHGPSDLATIGYPAADRKRRLTSTSQEARLQRTRSGEIAVQEDHIIGASPHRSVSKVVPSSWENAAAVPGSSRATAIDISSSPPEAASPDRLSRVLDRGNRLPSEVLTYRQVGDNRIRVEDPQRCQSAVAVEVGNNCASAGMSSSGYRHSPSGTILRTDAEVARDEEIRGMDLRAQAEMHTDLPLDTVRGSQIPSSIHERRLSVTMRDDADGNYLAPSLPISQANEDVEGLPRLSAQRDEDVEDIETNRTSSRMFSRYEHATSGTASDEQNLVRSAGGSRRQAAVDASRMLSFDERRLGETLRDESDERYLDMSLPRWQPDTEVSCCPICGTVFGFFYRKHHCRKCGRVVCASCSPHRITIPRQFIVRPPESTQQPTSSPIAPSQFIDLTGDDQAPLTPSINPGLGGGEEVRLCNPCVPDPNPNPPGYSAARSRGHRSTHSLPSTMGNCFSTEVHDERAPRRARRAPRVEFPPASGRQGRQSLPNNREAEQVRPRRATDLGHRPGPAVDTHRQSISPVVPEQDLCPVCGRAFPQLSAEEPIEAREAHIRQCIDNYGTPSARAEAETSAAPAASQEPPLPPLPVPVTRMVEFTSTEKDCSNADGGVAECTICMEDYQVGEVLVRLECLCKYHKHCLLNWFGRKMQCPVHIRS
ncbi:uncharacterized protein N7459_006262 [Penicillium hispanicum]|uniref:uncharacterized protein n=1 Tax=Penicillium hispanicum TaxID=1080232 RepID=UPI00253F8554|nr:uncharacterized protein N7459_006262 [Penicillium hispanicum]KAJ5580277.1 hypothetical protein N7459_006262 [Penicillium hispanicum]